MRAPRSFRRVFLFPVAFGMVLAGGLTAFAGTPGCPPFTDVAGDTFCPFVLEIFYLGITAGTTPTTYDPTANVSRLQMAAFLSRTVDGVLKRGGRRAALGQFWGTKGAVNLGLTTRVRERRGLRGAGEQRSGKRRREERDAR